MRSRLYFPSHVYYACEVIYGNRESFCTVRRGRSRRATSHLRFLQQHRRGAQGASLVHQEGLERGEKAFHVVDPELREQHLKLLAETGLTVHLAIDTRPL